MEHFREAGEEYEPSEGESIEGDKDDEGQPPGTTSPAHKSFEEAFYGWAKVPENSGEPPPMVDD